jgi:hypothetical protein
MGLNVNRLVVVALLSIVFAGTLPGQVEPKTSASDGGAIAAVEVALKSQIDVWNRGDLEAFMAGYWHSKQLTFISNSKETRGWAWVLNRYRQDYEYGGHQMGKLGMSWVMPIHLLGSDAAYVDGKWQRWMPDGKQPHGTFTLIFRKFPEGWLIVHEHTCTDETDSR